jgi:hypothetical protein
LLLRADVDLFPHSLSLSLSLSSLSRARRVLEFPFASLETCEIVFNSVNVDPPINPSRTTKELRLEEISSSSSEEEQGETAAKGAKAKIHARITAIDARSLRSAVVGLIDSIVLVVETVERCER